MLEHCLAVIYKPQLGTCEPLSIPSVAAQQHSTTQGPILTGEVS
jgi:hypothetical protein